MSWCGQPHLRRGGSARRRRLISVPKGDPRRWEPGAYTSEPSHWGHRNDTLDLRLTSQHRRPNGPLERDPPQDSDLRLACVRDRVGRHRHRRRPGLDRPAGHQRRPGAQGRPDPERGRLHAVGPLDGDRRRPEQEPDGRGCRVPRHGQCRGRRRRAVQLRAPAALAARTRPTAARSRRTGAPRSSNGTWRVRWRQPKSTSIR